MFVLLQSGIQVIQPCHPIEVCDHSLRGRIRVSNRNHPHLWNDPPTRLSEEIRIPCMYPTIHPYYCVIHQKKAFLSFISGFYMSYDPTLDLLRVSHTQGPKIPKLEALYSQTCSVRLARKRRLAPLCKREALHSQTCSEASTQAQTCPTLCFAMRVYCVSPMPQQADRELLPAAGVPAAVFNARGSHEIRQHVRDLAP